MLDLLGNRAVGRQDRPSLHSLDCRARLSRVWSLEDLVELFQADALGLDEEEVDVDDFEQVPKDEEDVEPISDLACC